jgi:Ca2+/Na+ antiporter
MYGFFLAVHNILRWIVLALLIIALVRALWGWFGKREWTSTDRKVGMFYSVSLDIQLLLGLLLYFVYSPITKTAFKDFGAAMASADLRFFALEHILMMVLAVVFAHVGVASAKRAEEPLLKHRRTAIWFTLSLIVILLGMPWFRPLLPGLS